MNKYLPKTNTGFTLVELLVVITIIAILAVVGITAFSATQKTARDGRRRADIDAIANAFETNYSPTVGTYSSVADSMFAGNKTPVDPGSNAYNFFPTSGTDTKFFVCAKLENKNGNSSANNPPAYSTSATNEYYCRSSQQSQ